MKKFINSTCVCVLSPKFLRGVVGALIALFTIHLNGASLSGNGKLGLDPNFTHYMRDTQESIGEVLSFTQDKDGFIWAAGAGGIARFEGYRVRIYKNDPYDPHSISFNHTSDIDVDSQGVLWAASNGAGILRYDPVLGKFVAYEHEPGNPNSPQTNSWRKIYEDNEGNLWFSGKGGIVLYDRDKDHFTRYLDNLGFSTYDFRDIVQIDKDVYLVGTMLEGMLKWNRRFDTIEKVGVSHKQNKLKHRSILKLLKDSKGRIWFGHNTGLSEYIPEENQFKQYELPPTAKNNNIIPVTEIYEGRDGTLWIGTDGGGLNYLDPNSLKIKAYRESGKESSLLNSVVRTVFEDDIGDLWIGYFPGGVDHFDRNNTYFHTFRNFSVDKLGTVRNGVWSFLEDENNNFWIGSDGAGLYYFNRDTNKISHTYKGTDLRTLDLPQAVLSLHRDNDDNIWLGSWSEGVARWNPSTNEIKRFHSLDETGGDFPALNIWAIHQDRDGDLWFATMRNGVVRLKLGEDEFIHYTHNAEDETSLVENAAWSLYEDSEGLIWVATFSGASYFDKKKNRFYKIVHNPNDPDSIKTNAVLNFFEDSVGRFWIGTEGSGLILYNRKSKRFATYDVTNGLPNNTVVSIEEDDLGNLWLGTLGGLSRFNPETAEIRNFGKRNWLQDELFSRGAKLLLSNGELVFGGINGFSLFNPENVRKNTHIAPVTISEFYIFNQPASPLSNVYPIEQDIRESKHVVLDHTQSVFTFKFTTPSYRNHGSILYQYKLDGFDKDWSPLSGKNDATYTNLDPGDYTFHTKAINSDGVWTRQQSDILITILPSPWNTWWAKSLYLLIFIGLVGGYIFQQKKRMYEQLKLNQKLLELDKFKDDFIANTSHELRTPINGVIGLAESLIGSDSSKLSTQEAEIVKLIIKSGKRLARQVDSIIDFAQLQKDSVKLEVKGQDLAGIINGVLSDSSLMPVNEAIKINNLIEKRKITILADRNKFQSALFELINNAIKYTEKGAISIDAEVLEREVVVLVKDTGIGIPEDKIENIFSSFEQAEDSGVRTKGGTGLGLALAKQLILLQGGAISVSSKRGEGSTFRVSIPLAKERNHTVVFDHRPDFGNNYVQQDNSLQKSDKKRVLIVDDESVNRMILRAYLTKYNCEVVEAETGLEATHWVFDQGDIDLVLLDVMMPKMSGFDACRKIREKLSRDRLPIIFITAKTQESDRKEGERCGGNAYLAKPIEKSELLSELNKFLSPLSGDTSASSVPS